MISSHIKFSVKVVVWSLFVHIIILSIPEAVHLKHDPSASLMDTHQLQNITESLLGILAKS